MRNILYFVIIVFLAASCTKDAGEGAPIGQGGSMARFAISSDGSVLYTVTTDSMKVFNIEDAANPIYHPQRNIRVGFDIETIFPMDTLLFIGSRNGMFIYDISEPRFPAFLSEARHFRSCDPVVAHGNYAYVTLNTISVNCGRTPHNVLDVYDISNLLKPTLIRTVQMNGPTGLGIDGAKQRLFVCDMGLKVYDISNPQNIKQIDDHVGITEVDIRKAYDVIPVKGSELLILVAKEGLFQFDYSGDRLRFVSKIEIKQ